MRFIGSAMFREKMAGGAGDRATCKLLIEFVDVGAAYTWHHAG
jgi:hypothetical protein